MSDANTEFREWFAKWCSSSITWSSADAPRPRGVLNHTLEYMKSKGIPLTRQAWLEFNYPDGVPDPLPAELAAEIPRELRDS